MLGEKNVPHLRRFGFLVGDATQRLPFGFAQGRRTGLVYAAPPALERKTWRDSGATEVPAGAFSQSRRTPEAWQKLAQLVRAGNENEDKLERRRRGT